MKKSPPHYRSLTLSCGLFTALVAGISAQAMAVDIYGGAQGVTASGIPEATSMRISGPGGFSAEVQNSTTYSGDTPLPNGSYRYEIRGPAPLPDDALDPKLRMSNGRDEQARANRAGATGVVASGHFRIVQGEVFIPGNESE